MHVTHLSMIIHPPRLRLTFPLTLLSNTLHYNHFPSPGRGPIARSLIKDLLIKLIDHADRKNGVNHPNHPIDSNDTNDAKVDAERMKKRNSSLKLLNYALKSMILTIKSIHIRIESPPSSGSRQPPHSHSQSQARAESQSRVQPQPHSQQHSQPLSQPRSQTKSQAPLSSQSPLPSQQPLPTTKCDALGCTIARIVMYPKVHWPPSFAHASRIYPFRHIYLLSNLLYFASCTYPFL